MLEQNGAALGNGLAVAQRRVLGRALDQLRQRLLAFRERQATQVLTVEIEQIEDVIDQPVLPAGFEFFLQQREAGDAVIAFDDQFAIDHRAVGIEFGDGVGDALECGRPVEALAGQQLGLAAGKPRLQAVAVKFDFMNPVGAVRRLVGERGEAGLDEAGQGGALGAFEAWFAIDDGRVLLYQLRRCRLLSRSLLSRFDLPCRHRLFGRCQDLLHPGLFPGTGPLAGGDLVHGAPGLDGEIGLLENILVARGAGHIVVRLDQQPVVALFAGALAQAHEMPGAVQLAAVEVEGEMAFLETLVRIVVWGPSAAVPHHDRAAAILALRNGALEGVVFDRMIFDLDGKALLARHQTGTTRHRPAFHDAIEFEAQVVMQPCGRMLLDDKSVAALARHLAFGLGGDAEAALAVIGLEPRHRSGPV